MPSYVHGEPWHTTARRRDHDIGLDGEEVLDRAVDACVAVEDDESVDGITGWDDDILPAGDDDTPVLAREHPALVGLRCAGLGRHLSGIERDPGLRAIILLLDGNLHHTGIR